MRKLVEQFFAASERGDLETVARLTHDDMVMFWPQSGERFSGRDNVLGAMRAQEIRPQIAGQPGIVGDGNIWVFSAPLLYGEELLHYVAILEFAGGRIRHATGYWGAPFPAKESRSQFAEPK